jgi:hypothetical protein
LDHELPLREVARGDGVVEILGGMAVIGASHHDCFLLQEILHTTCGLPVEFYVGFLTCLGDELECVHTEAFHVTVIGWDTNVVEQEREHVAGFRDVGEEVHDAPWLLEVALGVGLQGVDHVREFDPVPDEENWDIIPDHVEVPFPRVELHSEPTRVTERLGAASLVDHSGEADDQRGLHARRPEEVGAREVGDVVCHFEEALGAGAARVHHALRDALSVELRQLLHQVVILQQHRAAGTHRERVVVVPYRRPRVRGPERSVVLAGWPILSPKPKPTINYPSQIT